MKDIFEMTPVHMVCLSWAPYEVFSAVVLQNEDSIFTSEYTTKEYRSPIDYLCWIHQAEIKQGLRLSHEEIMFVLNSSADSDFKTFWKKLLLLLMVEYKNSGSRQSEKGVKKQSVVHATVSVKKCPIEILRLAVKLYPEELEILNEHQKLPLQVAIENGRSREEIEILVQAYPASIAMGNCPVYPFVLAALNGHEVATLFYLLRLCPELERFLCKEQATGRRIHEAMNTKHRIPTESSLYNDFGDENALQNIDCTEFDAALLRKKMRMIL